MVTRKIPDLQLGVQILIDLLMLLWTSDKSLICKIRVPCLIHGRSSKIHPRSGVMITYDPVTI